MNLSDPRARSLRVAILLDLCVAQDPYTTAKDANGNTLPNYSPLRPPSVPLAVRSPYTSVWSVASNNSTLNSRPPQFWTGRPVGWEGIVTVDGVSYEYLGSAVQDLPPLDTFLPAVPQDVSFDSQFSNFTFAAGPVEITASFFSPVIPTDLCRSSIPLSYLTTSVRPTDSQAHQVQLYSDVNGAWLGADSKDTLLWDLYVDGRITDGAAEDDDDDDDDDDDNDADSDSESSTADSLYSWMYRRKDPVTFAEDDDLPAWGNLTYTTSPLGGAANLSHQTGPASAVRWGFLATGRVAGTFDSGFRGFGRREPVFAFSHDFGNVGGSGSGSDSDSGAAAAMYTVGSVQDPAVRYLSSGGVSSLGPWWQACYGNLTQMVAFHWADYANASALGAAFEAQLLEDVGAFYSDGSDSDSDSGGGAAATVYATSGPTAQEFASNGTDQFGQQWVFDAGSAYGFLDPANYTGVAVPYVSEAESYYGIVALSARQVMGAFAYAIPPSTTSSSCGGGSSSSSSSNSSTSSSSSSPLVFMKEISSDGNVNTVDVLYPALPFFLYASPALLRCLLQPVLDLQEAGFYPNAYSLHDLGARFPNATGHVDGADEYMPVEECGDFILMSWAYYKFTGDAAWLAGHYALLRRQAAWLTDFALVPAAQLSTDDFAGRLANQTNLAIKGILGLAAVSGAARVAGRDDDARAFASTASAYYARWEGELALDPSGAHALLAYQWRSSWGLLYNLFPDQLLNLGLVSPRVYAAQSAWYARVSQVFGVPLDSRHHYAKSDWSLWAAASAAGPTRRLLVDALAYWLNQTLAEGPFPDLYEAIDGGAAPLVPQRVDFRARPVVGGHFALLALGRAGLKAGADDVPAGDTSTSLFPRNSTDPLP